MVTYTAAHTISDPLEKLLVGLKAAKRNLTQSRTYRHLAASRTGSVSATEITYGSKGWHAHQHDAWFFDLAAPDPNKLADELFDPWLNALTKEGMSAVQFYRDKRTGENRRIGVDVRAAWDASEYLTKFDRERNWSLAKEMTEGRSKQGRVQDSLTPWELLEDAIIRGKDSPTAKLWIEYLRATKGKSAISLMPAAKLLKELGMPTRLDDFIDANSVGVGEVIGKVSDHYFDRAVRECGLGSLLEAARNSALPELGGMLNFV
ncbi:hypothetical protein NX784_10600 [Massilia pinisoli]|uniref:Uncharacterized protein n=1 Tax=Massilia pinisoli TaxID=1772194 RepID=A0ABT1ZQ48_9BURK|nr:hypothetical protein [Massilia pinisoli]MCS0582040.1 hypothetical protein [Massilia pinisoli]